MMSSFRLDVAEDVHPEPSSGLRGEPQETT